MFLLLGGQGGLLSSHFLVPPASKMVTTVKSVVHCVETVETVKTVETYVGSTNGRPPAGGGFDAGFDSFDSFDSFDICSYGLDGEYAPYAHADMHAHAWASTHAFGS